MSVKILVVDDHPLNVELMQARLKLMGYQVLIACAGGHALEVVRQEQPEIILLDVMLPDMDGFQVLTVLNKEIVDNQYRPQIIMFSALDDNTVKEKASGMGVNIFLTKPITKAQLLEALDRTKK